MEAKQKKKQKPVPTIQSYYGHGGVQGWVADGYVAHEGLSTRLVGIEVEVENHELRAHPSRTWVATEDGSLRNNGMEWVTKPIPANLVPAALHNLFIESLSDDCCFSPRTSVHVHVNCLDMPVEKISNIVLLYTILEPMLYQFAGRGRSKNIFCVPLLETNLLNGCVHKETNDLVVGWSKYAGLNLLPLAEKGTIEFRHMHGTRDITKLTKWVDILTRLVDFCYKSDASELRKLLQGFNEQTNVRLLLLDIFGMSLMECFQYYDYNSVRDAVVNMKQAFMKVNATHQIAREIVGDSPFFSTKIQK